MSEKLPASGALKSKKRLSVQAARMREAKRLKHEAALASEDVPRPQQAESVSMELSDAREEASRVTETSGEERETAGSSSEPSRTAETSGDTSGGRDMSEQVVNVVTMGDEGVNSDLEERDAQDVFDDWMLTLTRLQRKMLSVLLYESFQSRQHMNKMDAAQESASITG